MSYDVVIRGGTVIDGTGAPARAADLAITDGHIVAVGAVDGAGRREIDADGALVTPGFVDIHTHYDGQATWDTRLQPTSSHGVTTAVMGNCGVGFAPVRPADRVRLIELMEGVEDLPGTVLHEGLPWTWESIDEYLAALDTPHDIDFATQVCHSPVRLFVMGERGAQREAATPDEIAEMGRIVAAGLRAGALGFSTSRTINHRTSRGEHTPTLTAARDELTGIARAVGETGIGFLQVISDLVDVDDEMITFNDMMAASGRPLLLSVMQTTPDDRYQRTLDAIAAANESGRSMRAVVASRAVGSLVTLDGTNAPFMRSAIYRSGADRHDPVVKATILAEIADKGGLRANYANLYPLGDPAVYAIDPTRSIAALAERERRTPEEVLYDALLVAPVYSPVFNAFDGTIDVARTMLMHPFALPGLGDGGAHVGVICDSSFPTTLLTQWGRDCPPAQRLPIEWLVSRQTSANAAAVGLHDRGVLAPGFKGDVNVIDFDRLNARAPRIVTDLPAGGKRLLQPADGYRHTFVNGVEVYANGEATGELPGRLVRSAR